jgi:hypothetical protein
MRIRTLYPGNNAAVIKTIQVCQSYIHVIDEVLLPTTDSVTTIPRVTSRLTGLSDGFGHPREHNP